MEPIELNTEKDIDLMYATTAYEFIKDLMLYNIDKWPNLRMTVEAKLTDIATYLYKYKN